MRGIHSVVDDLRRQVFTEVARLAYEGGDFSRIDALPYKIIPGEDAQYRHDVFLERAIVTERLRLACGLPLRTAAEMSLASDGMTLDMRWEQGEVEIEPDLFKTLMVNLIDNARKASRKGQTVEFFGKREDGGYAFYVRDHGRGMKKEDLSRITEPFYMIDKSRSRAQNGAGLGLALCQRIAELHGTALEYESEPGVGTTVRVLLKGGGEA